MTNIYVTKAAKAFNLSGEGQEFPASDLAVSHLENGLSELELLIVNKNDIKIIVHINEALEQGLFTPHSDVNYFHELFVDVLEQDLRTTTVRESNIKGIKSSGDYRVNSFFNHNKDYLRFMSQADQGKLKELSIRSANEALMKVEVNS